MTISIFTAGFRLNISRSVILLNIWTILPAAIFGCALHSRKDLWDGEFWSDGYYAGTVGERGDWSSVERYIVSQGKPKDELRRLKLF